MSSQTLEEVTRTWGPGDLAANGLGSFYTPAGLLENILDFAHVSCGLPWCVLYSLLLLVLLHMRDI